MVTTKADIESRIISVVAKCIGLSPDKLDTSLWQEPLTGYVLNLFEVDLIYILFEIEKEFNINIPPESLEQYGFSSINGISQDLQYTIQKG